MKNIFEKIFVYIYAIGFFLHFEIQEYTTRLDEYQEWQTDDLPLPSFTDIHHLEQMITEKENRLKTWELSCCSIGYAKVVHIAI